MNSLRMIWRTFIDWLAHSMRFLPCSASSRLLTSDRICVSVLGGIFPRVVSGVPAGLGPVFDSIPSTHVLGSVLPSATRTNKMQSVHYPSTAVLGYLCFV